MLRDHPAIERTERTGYANMVEQPEHYGTDFFGCEILEGDDVVVFEGEMVLRDNLEDSGKLEKFLSEMGFEFKTAI